MTELCVNCGLLRAEHHYNGAAYGICGEHQQSDFDYLTWAAQGRANADKLPTGVAEALGPERDWADDAWLGAFSKWQNTRGTGGHDVAAAVIREKCRPIGNDTVTGLVFKLDVAAKVFDTVRTSDAQDAMFNAGHAKLIREAIAALKATQ